jgi:membrane-associated phospholipid phosphatase
VDGHRPRPPRSSIALVLGGLSLVVIAGSALLAVQPRAESAQTRLVRWFNHPPQPFAAVFGAANPLLRPLPLVLVALVLAGWVLLTAADASLRLEALRALVVGGLLGELLAQVLKHLADQHRPLTVLAGLDTHGYPTSPRGNAYPSAHTAIIVAAVSALWPWMRWPQRIAGLAFAVLTACNRIYIGAHWPIDVLGGAAIGLLCGTITWLIAARWPLRASPGKGDVDGFGR